MLNGAFALRCHLAVLLWKSLVVSRLPAGERAGYVSAYQSKLPNGRYYAFYEVVWRKPTKYYLKELIWNCLGSIRLYFSSRCDWFPRRTSNKRTNNASFEGASWHESEAFALHKGDFIAYCNTTRYLLFDWLIRPNFSLWRWILKTMMTQTRR